MKKNWEVKKLGEISKIIAGQSPKGVYYNTNGDGLAFYQGKKEFGAKFVKDPKVWTTKSTKIAKKGDILMSVRAPVGPTNIATEEMCIGRGLAAIRPGEEVKRDYLYYFFKYFEDSIKGSEGSVFNSISKSQIESIKILIPNLLEQEKIVKTLSEKFEVIENLKTIVQEQLVSAKELFESRLNEVLLESEKKYKKERLEDVCEDLFAGGDVPKGNLSKSKTKEFNIPIFSNGEKNRGLYGYTNKARVSKPSLTIAARGTIGYVEIREEPFFPVVRLIVLTPSKDTIDIRYLRYVVRNMDFVHSGSAIPQLTIPMIKNYFVPLPPISLQVELVKELDELSQKTKKLEAIFKQKIADLEELKKSYLNEAFSGKL